MKVTKERFEQATHGLEESSREEYSHGGYNAHYGYGRGDGHVLVGWVSHMPDREDRLKFVTEYHLTQEVLCKS